MAWFDFLKAQGYFSPENNPEPVKVKDRFQIPYWGALGYLEKLSAQIKDGKELELIDEIIAIIKDISEHPKDNYTTWYLFILILNNLPNEKIPKELYNFIPVWLDGNFDTSLQSSELISKTLPKFLNDSPTTQDIEKAGIILQHLFEVQRVEVSEDGNPYDVKSGFKSKTDLHYLSKAFMKGGLAHKIIKHFPDTFLLELGIKIKTILLDYPNGISSEIKSGEQLYEINIRIESNSLLVKSKLKGGTTFNQTSSILDFENLASEELRYQLSQILKEKNIDYISTDDPSDIYERLNFHLNNDMASFFGHSPISKLGDRSHDRKKVLDNFCVIFRELLDEKAKQNPNDTVSILRTLCNSREYRLPFFKRLALYIIGQNWNETKILFWELVQDNDVFHFFSNHKYHRELYDLLDQNQQYLTESEKSVLQTIINQGDQEKIDNQKNYNEYWQLRWYSALKDTVPFKEKYLQLSKLLNINSKEFENIGEVRVRSGTISPISKDDLLLKNNQQIAELILSFQAAKDWESPNIDGLSETLAKAVTDAPQRFASDIQLYKDAPYIYIYRMLNAFGEAWKKKEHFDWEKVLQFCISYIEDERFYSEELKIEGDGWNATADLVVGSIANLLTDGLQNDENSFELELLPLAQKIILILASHLSPVDKDFEDVSMDFPMHSLNSTAGKVLRASLDYSLCKARNYLKHEEDKWEAEMRQLFEETMSKEIIDGHILLGMYFNQFHFLGKDWLINQVKLHYNTAPIKWLAFVNGYFFHNPPFSKDIYDLFYPHYEKAIESGVKPSSHYNSGMISHLAAFYYWGYETIEDGKLVSLFLNRAKPNEVADLVNFFWRLEESIKNLTEGERNNLIKLIFDLWSYLANKYESTENEEEQKILVALIHLTTFIPELNDAYTKLILKSCKHLEKVYVTHDLIENLVLLKNKGKPLESAEYVGQIISGIEFKNYISDYEQEPIIQLVSFLFENGQEKAAVGICNKMAIDQHLFLRETYDKYVKSKTQ